MSDEQKGAEVPVDFEIAVDKTSRGVFVQESVAQESVVESPVAEAPVVASPVPTLEFNLDFEPIEVNVPASVKAAQAAQDKKAAKPAAKTGTASTVARTPEAPKTFRYPFRVRYAAGMLDLVGFVNATEYKPDEITDLLIQNGFTEFANMKPEYVLNQATGTLVITIAGSKKGSAIRSLESLFSDIEKVFKATYAQQQSEDRYLIYRSEDGDLWSVYPPSKRTAGEVECDIPLTIIVSGVTYDLAYDLHSHHLMGVFWSPTDNANECIRGVTFGVFSWIDQDTWLFRRFTGQDFVDVPVTEVLDYVSQ